MRPGMQRDILVAFWLLFDEFEIGEDDPPPQDPSSASGKSSASPNAAANAGHPSAGRPDRS